MAECKCYVEKDEGYAVHFQQGKCDYCLTQKKIAGELLALVGLIRFGKFIVDKSPVYRAMTKLITRAKKAGIKTL